MRSIQKVSLLVNAAQHLTTLQDEADRALLDHRHHRGELVHALTF